MTGFYIAIEGGEGAGKTTVGGHLERLLTSAGHRVLMVREPGSTELGDEIRRLVLHSVAMTPWAEAMLFAAQRAQLVAEVVGPALAVGTTVISDRSLYSSLAYQGGGRRLGLQPVRMVNELAVGGRLPDLVVVLSIDPRTGRARQVEADRIGGEDDDFQKRVADAYRDLVEAEPGRVVIMKVDDGPEQVASRIVELVTDRQHRG
ncbi:MAG: dTMP kinase [Actinomycetota bacterium]